MSVINNGLLLASGADAAVGYQISRSLRFNAGDSAYISRVVSSAGNRKTFTLSWWMKKSGLTTFQSLFNSYTDSNNRTAVNFDSSIGAGGSGDYLTMFNVSGGATTSIFQTNALFRDVSAWYHIVVSVDTTQATSTDRVKLWVNNTLQTFSAYNAPSQNADLHWNSATTHYFGVFGGATGNTTLAFNGYLADVWFLDGTATTPSTFAETDAITGQWVPKTPTGISYGTNGFRLPFSDNSGTTSTTLGKDSAGSNNWTPNNFSVASGSGNDSLVDTPTSYGTDTGAGGEVRGNYATWNPLKGATTNSNGNLDASTTTGGSEATVATIGVSSGKWYWEVALTVTGTSAATVGIATNSFNATNYVGNDAGSWGYYSFDGSKYNNGSGSSYGSTYGNGDVIGVAFDADNGSLYFYKNGTVQNSGTAAYTGLTSGPYFPAVGDASSGGSFVFTLNAGQRPFAYTAPSGFKALVDTNLTAPVIAKPNTVMDAKTYSGNNSTQTISLNFNPDFIWLKCRNTARSHRLIDTVRGLSYQLFSNDTLGGNTYDATSYVSSVTSTSSSGFTVDNSGSDQYNTSGETYVAWAWDAGTSTVTNTAGSITSSVRANATAGFSIVSWTSTSSSATIGHGLGVEPHLIITKGRSGQDQWVTYHKSVGATKYLYLNATDAAATYSGFWNDTVPTSTVFTTGTDAIFTTNGRTKIAYCFAPVAGYSSFGSYTGNGSADGPFVYTGFRPRWILLKCSSLGGSGQNWIIVDTARNTGNVGDLLLRPNLSDAEVTYATCDALSNGFKLRNTDNSINGSSQTYVWAAFAESPFAYARAR